MKRKWILFWSTVIFTSACFGQMKTDTVSNSNEPDHEFCYTDLITRDPLDSD